LPKSVKIPDSEVPVEEVLAREISCVKDNLETITAILESHKETLLQIARSLRQAFDSGNKVLIFGNGGSAADAQHFAAELAGRYKRERKGYPAIAITTDTSAITAIGNDYGFDFVFSRQIEALGVEGDVAIGVSTSGSSKNIVRGLQKSKEQGMTTFAVTGGTGGEAAEIADAALIFPARETARVQEYHSIVFHLIAAMIDCGELRK
jgi:D-sedoheptulose 7-phosphate isomerase